MLGHFHIAAVLLHTLHNGSLQHKNKSSLGANQGKYVPNSCGPAKGSKASSEYQMLFVCSSIPRSSLHYLCAGGQGHSAPPGWLSGHQCSVSSAFLWFLLTRPTRTPGEQNVWKVDDTAKKEKRTNLAAKMRWKTSSIIGCRLGKFGMSRAFRREKSFVHTYFKILVGWWAWIQPSATCSEKKSSILSNKHHQIDGVSRSALAGKPSQRGSTLIKSWDGLV